MSNLFEFKNIYTHPPSGMVAYQINMLENKTKQKQHVEAKISIYMYLVLYFPSHFL